MVKNIQYGIYDRSAAYLGGPLGNVPLSKNFSPWEKIGKLGSPPQLMDFSSSSARRSSRFAAPRVVIGRQRYCSPPSRHFRIFGPCTEDEAWAIIMRSPSKSCSLDPIPTTILKECIDDLLPFLTAMCNASLLEGHLPVSQRHAIITPLIKKSNLDAADVKNYRPVSNLTFVSKVVEWLVSERACRFPAGKQLDAGRTVGVSKASFNRDCVASGHLGPPQLYGQTRGNAARFA